MAIQPSSVVSATNSFPAIQYENLGGLSGSLLPAGAMNLYHLTPFHEPRLPLSHLSNQVSHVHLRKILRQSNEQICPVENQEGSFLWKSLSPE